MTYRLTKIYTRQGDKGLTTFADHPIPKDDLILEVVGTLDELNSHIGMIIAFKIKSASIEACLTEVQHNLFNMGGEFHSPSHILITKELTADLEQQIDTWNNDLPPLKDFLLPRGNPKSAAAHIARTVCRRAERCLVRLHQQRPLHNPEMLRYLNRLSDFLFVAARMLAMETHEQELIWEQQDS